MTSPPLPVSISDKAFAPELSLSENLRRLRAAGFTHLHLSYKWKKPEPFTEEEEREWTRALTDTGIQVLDTHGCHPKGLNLWSESEADRQTAMDFFVRRLRLTHRLGGDAMVYHVQTGGPVRARGIQNLLEGLRRVEDLARELKLTIALENHYHPENDRATLDAAFEAFDADFIGFTFDPGHALLSGNTDWLLANCAPRLQVLHLNDNDTCKDHHWCPLDPEGVADWPRIMRFISAGPYAKPLQFEVRWNENRHGSHEAFLADVFASAVELERMRASAQGFNDPPSQTPAP